MRRAWLERGPAAAAEAGSRLAGIFGRQMLYVEVQRHRIPGEERWNGFLVDWARAERLPLLATTRARAPPRRGLAGAAGARGDEGGAGAGHRGRRALRLGRRGQRARALAVPGARAGLGRLLAGQAGLRPLRARGRAGRHRSAARRPLDAHLPGERPGLGTGDSLSIYLAYGPKLDQDNSEKSCISNVRRLGSADEVAREAAAMTVSAPSPPAAEE